MSEDFERRVLETLDAMRGEVHMVRATQDIMRAEMGQVVTRVAVLEDRDTHRDAPNADRVKEVEKTVAVMLDRQKHTDEKASKAAAAGITGGGVGFAAMLVEGVRLFWAYVQTGAP